MHTEIESMVKKLEQWAAVALKAVFEQPENVVRNADFQAAIESVKLGDLVSALRLMLQAANSGEMAA